MLTSDRFLKDTRQLGGMLAVTSLCVLLFPMRDAVTLAGVDANPEDALGISMLVGDLCVITLGFLGLWRRNTS